MEYISQSLTHCSKGNLQCVLQCTEFCNKQNNGLIFQKNCSSIRQRYMKLGDGLQRKRGLISTHALCLIMIFYHLQIKWNCAPHIIFYIQTGQHMWLQSPVFYVQCIDAWLHRYEYIYREHKRINDTTSEKFFQIPGWYHSLMQLEN